jgi:hypothetical protein
MAAAASPVPAPRITAVMPASPALAPPPAAPVAAPTTAAVVDGDDDGEDDALAASLASAPLAAATPRAAVRSSHGTAAAAASALSPASASSPAARRRSPLPAPSASALQQQLDVSAGSTSDDNSGADDDDDPILAALSSRKAPRPATAGSAPATGSPSSPAGAGTPPPLLQMAVRSAMLSARKAAAAKSAAASSSASAAATTGGGGGGSSAAAASVLLFSPQLVGGGARGGYAGLYSARKQQPQQPAAAPAPAPASPPSYTARPLQLSPSPVRAASAARASSPQAQPSASSPLASSSPDPIARLDCALAGLAAAEAVAARGGAPLAGDGEAADGDDDRCALYGPEDYRDNDGAYDDGGVTPASGAGATPSGFGATPATTDGSESSSPSTTSPMQGTVVVLQTVPARPSTARDLGVGTFLTPVRRSLRVYRSALASAITQITHQQQHQQGAATAAVAAPGSASRLHAAAATGGAGGGARAKKSVKFASDVGATSATATPGSAGSHLRRQATPFHSHQRASVDDRDTATPTADGVTPWGGDSSNGATPMHHPTGEEEVVDSALGCEAEGGDGADVSDAVSTPSSASASPPGASAAAVVVRPGVGVSAGTLTGITTPGRRNALPLEVPRPLQPLDGEGEADDEVGAATVVDVDAATPEQHVDGGASPVQHDAIVPARATPTAAGMARQQLPAGLFASPPPSLTRLAARERGATPTPSSFTSPVVARPGPFLGPRLAALQQQQQAAMAATAATFGTPTAAATPMQLPSPAAVTAAVARALIPGATLADVPDHLAWVPNPALPGVTLRAGHLYAAGGGEMR